MGLPCFHKGIDFEVLKGWSLKHCPLSGTQHLPSALEVKAEGRGRVFGGLKTTNPAGL